MTNVNFAPDSLDRHALLEALRSLRNGDFSVRLQGDLTGIDGEIAQAFNDLVEMNKLITGEFDRRPGPRGRSRIGPASRAKARVNDDLDSIVADDRVVVIIEDDLRFAGVLLDMVRENGFKGVVALDADTALALIRELEPDAITLDMNLPDMDGMAVLDLLKNDPISKRIPVSVISIDDRMHKCLQMGAYGVVQQPAVRATLQEALAKTRTLVDREVRMILVADADDAARISVTEALKAPGREVIALSDGKTTVETLAKNRIDCMVLGNSLRDMTALALIRKIVESDYSLDIPIVMYGSQNPSGGGRDRHHPHLENLAEITMLKCAGSTPDLLKQTSLFLHQSVKDPNPSRKTLIKNIQNDAPELTGRKVLIVDDDMRSVFALTGALERYNLIVVNAGNGNEGLEMLQDHPDVDIVLMDIMMPELDGYGAMRIIRGIEKFRDLPIIALTARAMDGDRGACLEAGASDYIAKPVKVDELLALMRVWVSRKAKRILPSTTGRRAGYAENQVLAGI